MIALMSCADLLRTTSSTRAAAERGSSPYESEVEGVQWTSVLRTLLGLSRTVVMSQAELGAGQAFLWAGRATSSTAYRRNHHLP
jgi:hypothetical protein